MSEEKFDAIIVGGGLAGCTASIVLARAGLEVLLIERGDTCGSKNMTGGRLYGHSLEKIIPNFADEAPVERVVKHEKISLMTADSSLDIGYNSKRLSETTENASYTILRGKFDQWMAEKAEEEGVAIATGFLVDQLVVENGKVVGVDVSGEIMLADVVILADGVNSLLAQKLGMKKELEPHQVAVGAKETIKLSEEIINQRFNLQKDEGVAWMSIGDPTAGGFGEGFLYTNKDTLSIGVVATLNDIGHSELSVPQMLERFKNHPTIAPLLEGGEAIEYSGHLVPEDGIHMIPELYRDGVLIAGDAAGLCINLGFTVRGMDLAIESGRLAAETVLKAREQGDYSAAVLSEYEQALNNSFVMQDMKAYSDLPKYLARRELFEDLPEKADNIANNLLTVNEDSSKKTIHSILEQENTRELIKLIKIVSEVF